MDNGTNGKKALSLAVNNSNLPVVPDHNGTTTTVVEADYNTMVEWAAHYDFKNCATRRNRDDVGKGNGPYNKIDVIAAIYATHGDLFAMTQLLGRSRFKLRQYIAKTPDVGEILNDERERLVDLAEKQLWKLVQEGDPVSIRFVLLTIGRSRGYSYKTESPAPEERQAAAITIMLPHNSRDKLQ